MIPELTHRHVCQQSRPGQPLLHRRQRLLGRDHGAALGAGVLLAGLLNDVQRGRHVLELLADLLADVPQFHLALGALPLVVGQVVDHAPPFQRLRQPLPPVSGRSGPWFARGRFRLRRLLPPAGNLGGKQKQLVLVDPLALLSVAVAQHLLEPVPHALQFVLLGRQCRLGGVQLRQGPQQHLLQGSWVAGQVFGVGLHGVSE